MPWEPLRWRASEPTSQQPTESPLEWHWFRLPMKNLKPKNLSGRTLHPWLSQNKLKPKYDIHYRHIISYRNCFTSTFLTGMQGGEAPATPKYFFRFLDVRPMFGLGDRKGQGLKTGYNISFACGMDCSHLKCPMGWLGFCTHIFVRSPCIDRRAFEGYKI